MGIEVAMSRSTRLPQNSSWDSPCWSLEELLSRVTLGSILEAKTLRQGQKTRILAIGRRSQSCSHLYSRLPAPSDLAARSTVHFNLFYASYLWAKLNPESAQVTGPWSLQYQAKFLLTSISNITYRSCHNTNLNRFSFLLILSPEYLTFQVEATVRVQSYPRTL
jgi:hypothetical protein